MCSTEYASPAPLTSPTASAGFSPTTSGTVTLESIFQIAKPATPAAMIATMARMMTATFIAPYLLVCPVAGPSPDIGIAGLPT